MNRRQALRAAIALAVSGGWLDKGVRAQQQGRVARIGYLAIGPLETSAHLLQAFKEGLREQGLAEGRNVELVVHRAHGSVDALSELAHELVRLQSTSSWPATTRPSQPRNVQLRRSQS